MITLYPKKKIWCVSSWMRSLVKPSADTEARFNLESTRCHMSMSVGDWGEVFTQTERVLYWGQHDSCTTCSFINTDSHLPTESESQSTDPLKIKYSIQIIKCSFTTFQRLLYKLWSKIDLEQVFFRQDSGCLGDQICSKNNNVGSRQGWCVCCAYYTAAGTVDQCAMCPTFHLRGPDSMLQHSHGSNFLSVKPS